MVPALAFELVLLNDLRAFTISRCLKFKHEDPSNLNLTF